MVKSSDSSCREQSSLCSFTGLQVDPHISETAPQWPHHTITRRHELAIHQLRVVPEPFCPKSNQFQLVKWVLVFIIVLASALWPACYQLTVFFDKFVSVRVYSNVDNKRKT